MSRDVYSTGQPQKLGSCKCAPAPFMETIITLGWAESECKMAAAKIQVHNIPVVPSMCVKLEQSLLSQLFRSVNNSPFCKEWAFLFCASALCPMD